MKRNTRWIVMLIAMAMPAGVAFGQESEKIKIEPGLLDSLVKPQPKKEESKPAPAPAPAPAAKQGEATAKPAAPIVPAAAASEEKTEPKKPDLAERAEQAAKAKNGEATGEATAPATGPDGLPLPPAPITPSAQTPFGGAPTPLIPPGTTSPPNNPASSPQPQPQPQPGAAPEPAKPALPKTYTIKPGDTFTSIAAKLLGDGRKWTSIAKANPLVDPTTLKVGQVIRMPDVPQQQLQREQELNAARTDAVEAGKATMVVVESGDNLSRIAERVYGKSSEWQRIFEANRDQLTDPDEIKVGMKLKVPPITASAAPNSPAPMPAGDSTADAR